MTKVTTQTPRTVWWAAVALCAVSALALGACSGSSKSGSSATTAAAAGAASGSGGGSAYSTTTENLGSGGGSFCDAVRQFQKDQDAIDNQAAAAGTAGAQSGAQSAPAAVNAAVLKSAQDSESAFPKMLSLAPDSLKAGLQTVWNASKPFLDAIIQAGGDMSKIPAGTQQSIQTSMSDPKFQAAGQALDSYGVHTCGFPPSTTTTSAP